MRLVIQRVQSASVSIVNQQQVTINKGMVIFVGIEDKDTLADSKWLVQKVIQMRIFADEDGKMNKSILEIGGSFLVVSQFTLFASTKKGNRPSYIRAARPEAAIPLYEQFIADLRSESSCLVETGSFGAHMMVNLVNDGPVTLLLDSKQKE